LCASRCLGGGWASFDLAENTAISEEVVRPFFHQFIEWGSTVLFNLHVNAPTDIATAIVQENEFKQAGLQGCISSMNASHIALERCSHRMRQEHLAQKPPCTARTCNVVVNPCRQILSTTQGHPARCSDKSIVKFDPFVMGLRRGNMLDDLAFELCELDDDDNAIVCKHKGACLLVDHGHHVWSATIPPIKITIF